MNSQKIEIIRPENCYVSEEESHISLENECYYYGYISRETAEWLLWEEGCNDGLYLLRNSGNDYVLSLCHQKRYSFETNNQTIISSSYLSLIIIFKYKELA